MFPILIGVFPEDMSLGGPGSAALGCPVIDVRRDYQSEEKRERKDKILLQGGEFTLHDCRMCALTEFLFKRVICHVVENRNTTFSESSGGSEEQKAETLSSMPDLGLGHSKSSRGRTRLVKVPSGSTQGKTTTGTHYRSIWLVFTQRG